MDDLNIEIKSFGRSVNNRAENLIVKTHFDNDILIEVKRDKTNYDSKDENGNYIREEIVQSVTMSKNTAIKLLLSLQKIMY